MKRLAVMVGLLVLAESWKEPLPRALRHPQTNRPRRSSRNIASTSGTRRRRRARPCRWRRSATWRQGSTASIATRSPTRRGRALGRAPGGHPQGGERRAVEIYAKMDPEAAALQLSEVGRSTAVSILSQLSPRKASAIMTVMEPGTGGGPGEGAGRAACDQQEGWRMMRLAIMAALATAILGGCAPDIDTFGVAPPLSPGRLGTGEIRGCRCGGRHAGVQWNKCQLDWWRRRLLPRRESPQGW